MRAVITEFTISNAAYFNALCYPDSVQDHVRRMKKPFEWGTHVEITALAAILSLPIFVATNMSSTTGQNMVPVKTKDGCIQSD